MALTEADAWADSLGLPRPDNPSPHVALGLGTARGDVLVPGEVCSGPCRRPFTAGEPYVPGEDGITCLGCACGAAA